MSDVLFDYKDAWNMAIDAISRIKAERDDYRKALQRFVSDGPSIRYNGDEDEVGECVHCGSLNYTGRPHDESCIWLVARDVLAKHASKETPK